MKIDVFKGNHFEFGKQQGLIYKKNGMIFDWVKINKNFYSRQLKIYKKFYPEMLDELRGIAIGGRYDVEKVIYAFLTSGIFSHI